MRIIENTSSSNHIHCVKSVRIRRYSGPYSVQMRKDTDQNNSEYGHFSRGDYYVLGRELNVDDMTQSIVLTLSYIMLKNACIMLKNGQPYRNIF